MMTDANKQNTPAGTDASLFVEHRRLTPTGRWFLVSTVVGPALLVGFVYMDEGRWATFTEWILVVAFYAALLLLLYWVMFGPYGGERKHVRVDADGLWVGGRLLPAEEIGACEVVPEARARRLLFRQRYGDVLMNRPGSSYSLSHDGPPVLVRQQRPGLRRRGWLVATHHPDELIAALHTAREHAAGPQR